MKKITLISATLLLLAAGCSKNKVEVIDDPQTEEDAWVNDLSLPVPIQFSSSSMSTKATPSGPIDGTNFNNALDLGIFALAVEYDRESSQYTQVWNRNRFPETILLENEHAVTAADGQINFDETKYYPISNEYSYSFYAYYPYTDSAIQTVEDYYKVTFDLGYTDILYASKNAYVSSVSGIIGFNAAYIRWMKKNNYEENTNVNTQLNFVHKLTSLKINVNTTADSNSNMRVQTVTLKNTAAQADLYVADSRPAGRNISGQIQATPGSTGKDIVLTDGTDTDFSDIALSNTGTVLSQFLVLPANEYTIEVTYGIYNGDGELDGVTTTSGNVTVKNGFQAGNRYNVNITLDEVEPIALTADITEWNDDTTDATWTPDEN